MQFYLFSRTMYVVSNCNNCRFSWITSSWSESLGGDAVMRVSQAWRRTGSTQASCAREPQRCRRLGLGLFSAGDRRRGQGQWRRAGRGEGRCKLWTRKGERPLSKFSTSFRTFWGILSTCYHFNAIVTLRQKKCTVLARHQSSRKKITKSCHSLSWKSLVKNFKTRLQNLAERFSLAVAIMICTSSPLGGRKGKKERSTLISISISSQSHLL